MDLSSIAALIVFRMKYPLDTFSHDDNRQKFNIDIGRSLALPQIIRRSAVLTLQNNITAVLDTPRPSANEDVSNLPAKKAKLEDEKRRRCDRCPSKKDKKTIVRERVKYLLKSLPLQDPLLNNASVAVMAQRQFQVRAAGILHEAVSCVVAS
ncbi:hypothetical protein RRG08_002543 [Elysia crispata]|uniref:Uncharacterized protein n=1 Tax=Elysia crispata TaxID=231223 RepID=A0AAE0Y5M4_9GAST|nr:hypothetical protein RRG08_002543 [Elysia crispata]